MKKLTVGFKINLMVDILAVIVVAAIFANYSALGTLKEMNATISDVCIELEKAQADIRDDFQQARIYADYSLYKKDTIGYDMMLDTLATRIRILETDFSETIELCKQSDDAALGTAADSLAAAMETFCPYIQSILDTAKEGDTESLQRMLNGLYPYTTQVENALAEFETAISDLTDSLMDSITSRTNVTHAADGIAAVICLSIWFFILIVVRGAISKPAKVSNQKLQSIVDKIESGNGDLTERIPVKTNDEIGLMGTGINNFIEQLQNIMIKLKNRANALMDSAAAVGTRVADSNENAGNVSAVMEELSASMQEISATLGQIAVGSNNVMDEVRNMDQRVRDGVDMVAQLKTHAGDMYRNTINSKEKTGCMIEEIRASLSEALEESRTVEQIQELTGEILSISSQTNLLSLNASIEAARAGDAGRGFSVVANEIRVLADGSAKTAGNIRNISELVTGAVDKLARSAGDMLRFIDDKVIKDYDDFVSIAQQYERDTDDVNELLLEFSANTSEINTTIHTMGQGINNISTAADESARGVATAAENVVSLVESISAIQEETENNKQISSQLEDEVNRFKNI